MQEWFPGLHPAPGHVLRRPQNVAWLGCCGWKVSCSVLDTWSFGCQQAIWWQGPVWHRAGAGALAAGDGPPGAASGARGSRLSRSLWEADDSLCTERGPGGQPALGAQDTG